MPSIFAPIATSRLHRSTISGSRAALNNWVRPRGEHRGHQRIFGRADRHHREAEVAARQPALGRGRLDVAGGELDLRAHALRAPSGAGRSGGRRSRSRRAARRSLRRRAPASARAPGSRRASCGPCRRARRSRRSRSACERHLAADLALLDARDLGRDAELVEQMARNCRRRRAAADCRASASRRSAARRAAASARCSWRREIGILPSRRLPPVMRMQSIAAL